MSQSRDDETFEDRTRPAPRLPRDEERIQDRPGGSRPPEARRDERDRDGRDRDDRDRDRDDERRRRRPRRDDDRDDGALSTMIPYKNGMALTAYYLGVFSLIPLLGIILGILAIIFGILGLRAVNQRPEVKGTGHSVTGIVIGSLSLLGHLVLFMMFALAARH